MAIEQHHQAGADGHGGTRAAHGGASRTNPRTSGAARSTAGTGTGPSAGTGVRPSGGTANRAPGGGANRTGANRSGANRSGANRSGANRSGPARTGGPARAATAAGRGRHRAVAPPEGAAPGTLADRLGLPGIGQSLPRLGMPNLAAGPVGPAVRQAVDRVRGSLPATDRLVFFAGLGVAAVAGIVELPVAAAIGAGVWVAARARRNGRETAGSTGAGTRAAGVGTRARATGEQARGTGEQARGTGTASRTGATGAREQGTTRGRLSVAGAGQTVPSDQLPHAPGR